MAHCILTLMTARRAFAAAAGLALLLAAAPAAHAHGSLEDPPSRIFSCYFLTPDNPLCSQAWAANPQALYDWTEINLGTVDGRHMELIPDGQLCSAGRAKYAAFDATGSAWPTTVIRPDSDGKHTIIWRSTAPHSTEYFRLYLTREGFDPDQPLRWSDLELVYDSGPWAAVNPVVLRTALPRRSGHAILYVVWQRDDSPEAFYSCSDVVFGDGTSNTPPPTAAPPAEVALTLTPQSDWGGGYCMNATVSTTSAQRIDWTVSFHLHDTITNTWNALIVQDDHTVTAEGLEFNNAVSASQPQSFGFCATRDAMPVGSPTPTPTASPSPVRSAAATASATRAPSAVASATRTVSAVAGTPTRTPSAVAASPTRSPSAVAASPTRTSAATRTVTAMRTSSPTRTPSIRRSPSPTATAASALGIQQTITSDWGTGYCSAVVLTTASTTPIDWRVSFAIDGRVRELWSALWSQSGSMVSAEGLSWNNTVVRGTPVQFGYCANR